MRDGGGVIWQAGRGPAGIRGMICVMVRDSDLAGTHIGLHPLFSGWLASIVGGKT